MPTASPQPPSWLPCLTLSLSLPLSLPPSLNHIQLFPSTLVQTQMQGESPYNIMFGPDICGPGTKKVHVIFNYKGNNVLIDKDIRCKVSLGRGVQALISQPRRTRKA